MKLAIFFLLLLSACGGGGGSSSSNEPNASQTSNNSSASSSSTPSRISFIVENLDLSDADTLVRFGSTDGTTPVGNSLKISEQFISQSNNISSKNSNSEDINPLLKIQSNSVIYSNDNAIWPIKNDITSTSVIRKQVGSEVLTIPLIYKILQGNLPSDCDLNQFEVDVSEAWEIKNNWYLLKLSYPSSVDENCENVRHSEFKYHVIDNSGNIFDISDFFTQFEGIIPANDGIWNSTNDPILLGYSMIPKVMEVNDDGSLTFTDLTIAPTYGQTSPYLDGSFLYDGTYVLECSNSRGGLDLDIKISKKGETGYTLVRNPRGAGNSWQCIKFIDKDGDFFFMDQLSMWSINKETGDFFNKWGRPDNNQYNNNKFQDYDFSPNTIDFNQLNCDGDFGIAGCATFYANRQVIGRVDDFVILNSNSFVYNLDTAEFFTICTGKKKYPSLSNPIVNDATHVTSFRSGRYLYCSRAQHIFTRYDFQTDSIVSFDADSIGLEVLENNFIFGNNSVVFKAIDTTTEDVKLGVFNFNDNSYEDLGTIETSEGRKAYTVLPIQGS